MPSQLGTRGRAINRGMILVPLCLLAMGFLVSCGPDASTPKKAATAFAKAVETGDMDTVHKVATGTDAQFNMVKQLSEVMQASKRYEQAAVSKFGDEGKLGKEEMHDLTSKVETADEKIEGDTATLSFKKSAGPHDQMKLKKEGSSWKVDLSSMGSGDAEIASAAPMMKAMAEAYDGTAKDIDAGKIKSAKEAHKDVEERIGKAMFGNIKLDLPKK